MLCIVSSQQSTCESPQNRIIFSGKSEHAQGYGDQNEVRNHIGQKVVRDESGFRNSPKKNLQVLK